MFREYTVEPSVPAQEINPITYLAYYRQISGPDRELNPGPVAS